MPFEFKQHEPPQATARRILAGVIDDALATLGPRPSEKAVHNARKSFKKARALLRVVRDAVGRKTFARANQTFRDAGRALAAARDAAVLVTSFDTLLKHFRVPADAMRPIRRALLARRHEAVTGTADARRALTLLRTEGRALRKLTLNEDGWPAVAPGVERLYRQGRRAMKLARAEPDADVLHHWRKRVKDLWHATQLLAPVWPQELEPFGDQLHHLADLLGDDHDLALLRDTVAGDRKAFPDAATRTVELIDARRAELEREAFDLGERLYAEKPKALVKRWHGYWHAWHAPEDDPT